MGENIKMDVMINRIWGCGLQ